MIQQEEMGLTLEKAGFEVMQGLGPGGEDMDATWKQGKWDDKHM